MSWGFHWKILWPCSCWTVRTSPACFPLHWNPFRSPYWLIDCCNIAKIHSFFSRLFKPSFWHYVGFWSCFVICLSILSDYSKVMRGFAWVILSSISGFISKMNVPVSDYWLPYGVITIFVVSSKNGPLRLCSCSCFWDCLKVLDSLKWIFIGLCNFHTLGPLQVESKTCYYFACNFTTD